MKLTKYRHACFAIEKDSKSIVVDPGNFSSDFVTPDNIVAIIITHEHHDHFDPNHIAAIIMKNPTAVVIGNQVITSKLPGLTTKSVKSGDKMHLGPFNLAFFGGDHAIIHSSIPPISNLSVLIDDSLYYPGDSFVLPGMPVDTLALPISAPWLKIGEAIDFLLAVHPRLAFPTHDAVLSNEGKDIVDRLLLAAATPNQIQYQRISSPIEIK